MESCPLGNMKVDRQARTHEPECTIGVTPRVGCLGARPPETGSLMGTEEPAACGYSRRRGPAQVAETPRVCPKQVVRVPANQCSWCLVPCSMELHALMCSVLSRAPCHGTMVPSCVPGVTCPTPRRCGALTCSVLSRALRRGAAVPSRVLCCHVLCAEVLRCPHIFLASHAPAGLQVGRGPALEPLGPSHLMASRPSVPHAVLGASVPAAPGLILLLLLLPPTQVAAIAHGHPRIEGVSLNRDVGRTLPSPS